MRNRSRNDSSSLVASLAIGGGIFGCLFLAFSWGNSLLRQAAVENNLSSYEQENTRLKKENEASLQRLRYLESEQYRDKWAKENKGLAQANEKVIIVEYESKNLESLEEDESALRREILLMRPKREQWKIFFFEQEDAVTSN